VAQQPDALVTYNDKYHKLKPDNDADGSQVAGNGCGNGQCYDDFQDAAPERLARIKAPEDELAHHEQKNDQRERDKQGRSVWRNGTPFPANLGMAWQHKWEMEKGG